MSEVKLYAVKNDEGKYLVMAIRAPWWNDQSGTVLKSIDFALARAKNHGGHVVTLIEEPKKVVLTKKQAEIVDAAHNSKRPASYIILKSNDEELLMNAYVNGYTVAKEKKYVVYKNLGGKHNTDVQYAQAYRSSAHSETFSWTITSWILNDEDINGSSFQFTESEIEHYGLQDCEKEEVTDDAD